MAENFKDELKEWSNILAMSKLLQSEVKENGLSANSLNHFIESFKQNDLKTDTPVSKAVYTQIEKYLLPVPNLWVELSLFNLNTIWVQQNALPDLWT